MVIPLSRAISYARFSTSRQAGGSSIERQLKLTREYCEKHNLTLDDSLTDEGLSAYRGDHTARGSLGRFMEAVEKGQVDRGTYLIVEALDRLSREAVRPALTQFLRIIDAGIKIVTLFDGRVYTDSSESVEIDLIVAILNMSEAHKSSLSKSTRLKEAWNIKRASGARQTSICPAWLSPIRGRNGVGTTFTPNSGAAVIQRIFREAASGIGSFSIAKRLNDDGILPLTGDKKHGKDHPKAGQSISNGWNRGRINQIIRSDAVLGWYQPHKRDGKNRVPVGEPIKDYYPAIVSQSVVDRARANVSSRKFAGVGSGRKGEVISNLFSTVAKCAQCGNSMFLVARTKASGKPGRLRCSMAIRNKTVCDSPVSIPYKRLETQFLRDFKIIKQIVHLSSHDDETAGLTETIARTRAEADKLKTAIDNMALSFSNPLPVIAAQMQSMAERHAALTHELGDLEKRLASERQTIRNMDQLEIEYLTERFESPDLNIVRKARSQVSTVIRQILKEPMVCRADNTVIAAATMLDTGEMISIRYLDGSRLIQPSRRIPVVYVDDAVSETKSYFAETKGYLASDLLDDNPAVYVGETKVANLRDVMTDGKIDVLHIFGRWMLITDDDPTVPPFNLQDVAIIRP